MRCDPHVHRFALACAFYVAFLSCCFCFILVVLSLGDCFGFGCVLHFVWLVSPEHPCISVEVLLERGRLHLLKT